MTRRILVPVDGSEQVATAATFGIENFPGATVVLFHVINPSESGYSAKASVSSVSDEWYEEQQAEARERFDELEASIGDGNSIDRVVEMGRPNATIVNYAEDNDIDQIVMGSQDQSGVSRLLLDCDPEDVVRRATVPVTVVR